jgi:hypothetical protein
MRTVRRGGSLSRRLHPAGDSLHEVLFAAVLEYPIWERVLGQEDTLEVMSAVGEIEMAVWLCNAEYDTVVCLVASPFIQRQEIMGGPCPLVSASVLVDHVQVLPALGTMAVLPDESCILRAVVKLHLSALGLTPDGPRSQHPDAPSSFFFSGNGGILGRRCGTQLLPECVGKGPKAALRSDSLVACMQST